MPNYAICPLNKCKMSDLCILHKSTSIPGKGQTYIKFDPLSEMGENTCKHFFPVMEFNFPFVKVPVELK